MNNDCLKMYITIRTANEDEKMRIANSIYHQLVCNSDYVDSKIVLNIDAGDEVNLYIFDECENIPDIII